MKRNKLFFVLLLLCPGFILYGQDVLPLRIKSEKPAFVPRQTKERNTVYKIPVKNSLPVSFKGTTENHIDSAQWLSPVFERLSAAANGYSGDTVRILHIGDSHVRGHIFPRTAGDELIRTFGTVSYVDMGINGATNLTFTHAAHISDIAAFRPELLVMSFGTNESHGRGYNPLVHYRQIDELVGLLRDSLPDVAILLTTPPGSYESYRRKRRKRTYAVNPRTETAVGTIKRYAGEHGMAVWDMYNLMGGKSNACTNWQSKGMMRPDHVHYTPEGYRLQGELFYEALIKAYNDYVSR